MGRDRFVYFSPPSVPVPTRAELQLAIEDYLGAFLKTLDWSSGRWMAELVGHNSWALRRLRPDYPYAADYAERSQFVRWFEVFIHDDAVDVITRATDNATNALADGFARRVARTWQGRLDLEGVDHGPIPAPPFAPAQGQPSCPSCGRPLTQAEPAAVTVNPSPSAWYCRHCQAPPQGMDRPECCPRCDAPAPHLHPAVQHGGEVQPCTHPWHEAIERKEADPS